MSRKNKVSIQDLTPADFISLLDSYFAKSEKRSKLTPSEIKTIAERLNDKIDVPIINETREGKIFYKIVLRVDTFLYDNLPNEFYDLVRSVQDGIDDEEARRLTRRLSKLANDKIDIPYIPEQFEYWAIRMVISIIINAARKNWDFLKASEKVDSMQIPSDKEANETALENMVLKYG